MLQQDGDGVDGDDGDGVVDDGDDDPDEVQRDDDDDVAEEPNVEAKEKLRGDELRALGGVHQVHGDVEGLNDAPDAVDGEEELGAGLEEGVVHPEHAAEERHNVRSRLEPLRRLLTVHTVERRTASAYPMS